MIILSDGKQIKIETDLPIECSWDKKTGSLIIKYKRQDGTEKKYYLRKSFKDGLVLN